MAAQARVRSLGPEAADYRRRCTRAVSGRYAKRGGHRNPTGAGGCSPAVHVLSCNRGLPACRRSLGRSPGSRRHVCGRVSDREDTSFGKRNLPVVAFGHFLHRGRFQVVHAHDPWANLLGVPAAWLARTPIIISSRRYLADPEEQRDRPLRRKWRNKAARMLFRLSTNVVVNSTSVRDVLVKRDGLPPEKIRVIHNGVDLDRFASARRDREGLFPGVGNSSKLIAVVANMHSRVKGHACLIAAACTVCREVPEAIFILIGDGKERTKLAQQVREAGLEESFLFLGFRDDVPELLAGCDLAVLPSASEGLPNP